MRAAFVAVATLLAGCGASIRNAPQASTATPLVPAASGGGSLAFPRGFDAVSAAPA